VTTSTDAATRRDLFGGVLAAAASLQFGVIVVVGKRVLERGMTVESMLAFRFWVAASLLVLVLVVLRRPLLAAPGERVGTAALAVFGYGVEATFFFTAARHGTAAAVTLLFFTYPVFVTLGAWFFGRRSPARLTVAALVLAVVGAGIVAGTGAGLSIDSTGVVFALAAALTYSAYLLGADAVLRRTHPLGAASAGAFVCLMGALQRIGAVRTAIVSATEPLSAALLGYLFLGEAVDAGTAIGGGLILVAAVMASLARAAMPREQQIP